MNFKKIFITISSLFLLSVSPAMAFAQTATPTPGVSYYQNLYSQLKSFETSNPQFVRRGDITLSAINGSTLTGSNAAGTTFTINAGSAIIVRKFWGQSNLSQISVGDRIRVIGTWTDSTKTTINAFLIRDMVTQERNDTFGGTVTALSGSSFSFQSMNRGVWTVNTSGSTTFTGRGGASMQLSNIQVNDRLRIDGMLDSANKVITASTIRDMSYPAVSGTPYPFHNRWQK